MVCRNKAKHTDCVADMFVIYMFVNGDMYEFPPWEFVNSVMLDRVVMVSYGLCSSCKEVE